MFLSTLHALIGDCACECIDLVGIVLVTRGKAHLINHGAVVELGHAGFDFINLILCDSRVLERRSLRLVFADSVFRLGYLFLFALLAALFRLRCRFRRSCLICCCFFYELSFFSE